MKKFLFIFVFALFLIPNIDIKADSITNYEYYLAVKKTDNSYMVVVAPTFNDWTSNNITYTKPFAYVEHDSQWHADSLYLYCGGNQQYFANSSISDFNNVLLSNAGNGINGFGGLDSSNAIQPYVIESNIPVFNNLQSGLAYASNQPYNGNNIIGGTRPPYEIDEDKVFVNAITNVEYVFRPDTGRKSLFLQWQQDYDLDVVNGDMRGVVLSITYPDLEYMQVIDMKYNGSPVDMLTADAILSVARQEYEDGKGQGDYLGHALTLDCYYAIDKDLSQWGANDTIGCFVEQSSSNNRSFQCTIVDSHYVISGLNIEYECLRGGLIDTLLNYYGSEELLTLAIPYISFDKVSMFTYNDLNRVIYNDYYIYWLNMTKSNGQITERRSFGNKTTLNENNIDSVPENSTGFPTGGSVPKPSTQQTDSAYNQSIQDSYNNVYNNYYNDSNYSQSIIDYLNQYADGGTQENIDNAFGYVNSTVKSVSNIPTLLKNCFNSFFPPEVIKLFSALFIIFAVFCIIKIIKHIII